MSKIKIGDYVEGFEYYGRTIQKMQGWVSSINYKKDKSIDSVDIRCDDNYHGYRGNTLFRELGEITLLPFKEYVDTYIL